MIFIHDRDRNHKENSGTAADIALVTSLVVLAGQSMTGKLGLDFWCLRLEQSRRKVQE